MTFADSESEGEESPLAQSSPVPPSPEGQEDEALPHTPMECDPKDPPVGSSSSTAFASGGLTFIPSKLMGPGRYEVRALSGANPSFVVEVLQSGPPGEQGPATGMAGGQRPQPSGVEGFANFVKGLSKRGQ